MHGSTSDSSSDISTLPDRSAGGESWLVTPPPCFTAGARPLESSSMENLLMEHPSMSVYHRGVRGGAKAVPRKALVGRRRRWSRRLKERDGDGDAPTRDITRSSTSAPAHRSTRAAACHTLVGHLQDREGTPAQEPGGQKPRPS